MCLLIRNKTISLNASVRALRPVLRCPLASDFSIGDSKNSIIIIIIIIIIGIRDNTDETSYKNIVGSRGNVLLTNMFLNRLILHKSKYDTFPTNMFL